MAMQVVAFVVSMGLVELTPQRALAIVLPACLLGWWVLLLTDYGLRRKSQHSTRAVGDKILAVEMLVATLVPLATGAALGSDSVVWKHDHVALAVGFVAVGSLWLATLASSLLDWYYVYPRRDGVIGEPPCRRSDRDWTAFTRLWYAHRASAGILGAVALIVATTSFAYAAFGEPPLAVDKLGTLLLTSAATGLALTRLVYGNLTTLGQVVSACCLSPPDIVVGDRLQGPEGFLGGYVRDISLEGITVVRLGKHDQVLYDSRLKRHGIKDVLDRSDVEGRPPFKPCEKGCSRINPTCQRRQALGKPG
jgi:hypothetical protein